MGLMDKLRSNKTDCTGKYGEVEREDGSTGPGIKMKCANDTKDKRIFEGDSEVAEEKALEFLEEEDKTARIIK